MDVQQDIEKLKIYPTCDISDALLKLKHPLGGYLDGITMWSPERQAGPTRIAGLAHTVKFVRNTDTGAPRPEGHYIDSIPQGSIVFISIPEGIKHGAWGGLMTHRARHLGAIGTIVDGNFRDLHEQRDLSYPVFARGVATPAYIEVARPSEIGVPLLLQDGVTTVSQGDIIVADLNGVVCVPRSLLSKVVEAVARAAEGDAKMEAYIDNGGTFLEASQRFRGW